MGNIGHNTKHNITSTTDHNGVAGATEDNLFSFDGNGLPKDSGILSSAVALLPVADTTTIIKGSVDPTKLLRFEVDGLTASTTRVITMADANVDLGDIALNNTHRGAANPHSGSAAAGANSDITSLSGITGNISTPNSIILNTTPSIVWAEGTLRWNADSKTLEVDTELEDISIELGHTMVKRVRNDSGTPIEKGKIVRLEGVPVGDVPLIELADADTEALSVGTIGMLVKDIADGGIGYIVTAGTIKGINTIGATIGATIYLSSTVGDWTEVMPVTPAHLVAIGKITKADSNGTIEISIDNGFEISELHDVLITSITDGDILEWDNANSYWVNNNTLSSHVAASNPHSGSAPINAPTFTTSVTIVETAGIADYDKFLVVDTGVIKYRTGAEVLSDIGAGIPGASFALDNLAGVAINTSLISDTNNTDDLGSTSIKWKDLWLAGNLQDGTNTVTIANIQSNITHSSGDGTDHSKVASAIHDDESGEIAAITEKTVLVDADMVILEDSAASNVKKRGLFSTIWNYIVSKLGTVTNEPTGFESRATSTLSFTDGTRTASIQPTVTNFDYWFQGVKHTSTGDTLVISDVSGTHIVYYSDAVGTLSESVNPTRETQHDLYEDNAPVMAVYWNATTATAYLLGDERHGVSMDNETHATLHVGIGSIWVSGLGLTSIIAGGDGSSDTHIQLGTEAGSFEDEDILHSISVRTAPASFKIGHRTGASGEWIFDASTTFPVKSFVGGGSRVAFNEFTGGVWQQTEVAHTNYCLYHFFVDNDINDNWIIVQGQAEYSTISAARAGANTEIGALRTGSILAPEIKTIGSIIVQTKNTFSNAKKAIIVSTEEGEDYVDFRTSGVVGNGAIAPAPQNLYETFTGDSGSSTASGSVDTMVVVGGNGITTVVTDDQISVNGDDATTSTKGVASFATADFTVSSGAVSVKLITSQAGVPSSTPAKVGDINIDTTNDVAYIATGTASSADWKTSTRKVVHMMFNLVEKATSVATGTNLYGDFVLPFSGTFIQSDSNKQWLMANNSTAGITSTMTVDVSLEGTTIMTTNKISIETTEKTSEDAATQPDLTTTSFTAGDILTIDADAIHSGTPALGLSVTVSALMDG